MMERRALFTGAAAASAALLPIKANAYPSYEGLPNDVAAALARFRATIPPNFERDYVEHAVVPFFLTSVYEGERPVLPMIDVTLTKQDALPFDLWGLIYKPWRPTPSEGVTVFLEGLENRGENNLRKKIYSSAVTPDLYKSKYQKKVVDFFDALLDDEHAGKPFMRHYLDYYFDIYWDLHLGVKGDAVPTEVRQIGEAFNTVLAYRNPMREIVHENYMKVRSLLDPLKGWIGDRVDDMESGRLADPDRTIAWYWLKNAGDGQYFSRKDIVFEVFHNFVAFSQWGNTIFGIMSRLRENDGNAEVRAAFEKTMSGDYDNANGAPYSPLERLVMELFRTISPNGGSLSALEDARQSDRGASPHLVLDARFARYGYMATPHPATSFDPVQWQNPRQFDPDRYLHVPTSADIDEAHCKQIGLARCPFDVTAMDVADGRNAKIANSGFGTVFGVVDGKPLPVCDHAGFAPFGFGYRRCPGEQLTINVFEDFLRKVWTDKIRFVTLGQPVPGQVPIGPNTVIEDDIGFTRAS